MELEAFEFLMSRDRIKDVAIAAECGCEISREAALEYSLGPWPQVN
jgi:hypothetical protein